MKARSLPSFLLSLALGAACQAVQASDAYPSHPVQLIVGYAAGGPTDVTARVIAKELSESLGASFVVANKTGSASLIATKEVLRAKPDGYTLLFASLGHNVNPMVLPKSADYDPIKDFEPITLVATQPLVVVTAYDSKLKTLQDIVDQARQQPKSISFGSAGLGGSAQLAAELLGLKAGVQMLHVPFRGNAPALTEVIAGRVSFMFYPSIGIAEQVETRRLRVIAVGPSKGLSQFPGVPTMAQLGYSGFDDAAPWVGLLAPKDTPKAIVDQLNVAMTAILAKPAVRERLEALGNVVVGGTPAAFADYLKTNTETMRTVVQAAGITMPE